MRRRRHAGNAIGGIEWGKLNQNGNLDDIDAVLHLGADGVSDLFGAVGDGEVTLFGEHGDAGLGGVVVEVAVAAGDGEWRAGGYDPRAGEEAFVDGVAEVDGHEGEGTYVADAGESGIESSLGVDDAGIGSGERGFFEGVDGVVLVGAGSEVGVAVDETGEDVVVA